jgi:peptidoglycan-associated lipoprotein
MLMPLTLRSAVNSAVMFAALLALGACATPKPPEPAPVAPPPAAPPPPPARPTPPPPPPVARGPIPGSVEDFVVSAGDRVYFDFDQYTVRPDGRLVLDLQAAWLNRYPAVQVRIEGNCDERGTREYNLALGARRAEAVRAYLVSRGVSAARITTISYGKERPIDPGTSEDAWAKNRNGHTTIVSGAR